MKPNWDNISKILKANSEDEVKKLLETEFDNEKTLFILAVENRQYAIVQAILNSNYFNTTIMNQRDKTRHYTALLSAVEMKDLKMVRAIVNSEHCNLETLSLQNYSGWSPLLLCWSKQVDPAIAAEIEKATPLPNLRKTQHFFTSSIRKLAETSVLPIAASIGCTSLVVSHNNPEADYNATKTVKDNAGMLALGLMSFLITVPLTVVTMGLSLVCAVLLMAAAPFAFAIAGIKDSENRCTKDSEQTPRTPLLC